MNLPLILLEVINTKFYGFQKKSSNEIDYLECSFASFKLSLKRPIKPQSYTKYGRYLGAHFLLPVVFKHHKTELHSCGLADGWTTQNYKRDACTPPQTNILSDVTANVTAHPDKVVECQSERFDQSGYQVA